MNKKFKIIFGLFFLFVSIILTQLFISGVSEKVRSFSSEQKIQNQFAKVLDERNSEDNESELMFRLENSDLKRSKTLVFHFGTYYKELQPIAVEVRFGGGCLFSSNSKILDNAPYTLYPNKDCETEKNIEKNVSLNLKFDFPTPKIALWVQEVKSSGPKPVIKLLESGNKTIVPLGTYTKQFEGKVFKKIELLNYLWFGETSFSVFRFFVFSFFLIGIGLFFLNYPFKNLKKINSFVIGIFLVFFGMTSLTSIAVPPFHAPDEPSHLLTISSHIKNKKIKSDAEISANRGNFARIRSNADEKFTSADIESPSKSGWGPRISEYNLSSRSPVSFHVWKSLKYVFETFSTSVGIILIRLANGLFVALALGMSLKKLLEVSKEDSWILSIGWFLIPTLPFFSMHISNYPILIGLYLLNISIALCFLFKDCRNLINGCLLGLVLGATVLTSRSSIPLIFFWVFYLFGVNLVYRELKNLKTIYFYLSIYFVLAFFFWMISTNEYAFSLNKIFSAGKIILVKDFRLNLVLLGTAYYFAFFLANCIVIFAFNKIDLFKRLVIFHGFSKNISKILAILFILFIIKINLKIPTFLPDIESGLKISFFSYLKLYLKELAYSLRFFNSDFYLSASFWSGYGWLEARINTFWIALANLFVISSIFCFLRNLYNGIPTQRISLFVFYGLGILLYAIGMLYGTFGDKINIHGRYLIGFYLFVLAICSFQFLDSKLKNLFKENGAFYISITILVIQLYSICFLMNRYFA